MKITLPLICSDFVLCGESEEDLRAMVGHFEVCRSRVLKVTMGNLEHGDGTEWRGGIEARLRI